MVPMNETLDQLPGQLAALAASYGMNLLGGILILIVGFAAAGWLSRLTTRALRRSDKVDPVFQPLAGKVVRLAVIVFTVIAVLNRFGVETTSLIAMLGAAGLAIGLALQGTLSNVAAGVMILVFRPFKVGDAVNLGGDVYIIDSLGFFICTAHLPDGPIAFLPNSKIWGQTILNLSVTDKDIRRIDEHYRIGYDDDINQAIAILKQIVADEARILEDPAPLITVDALDDNSVNILFRVWTARAAWWTTKLELIQRCKEALEAGGIRIALPRRQLHLIGQPGAPTPAGVPMSTTSASTPDVEPG